MKIDKINRKYFDTIVYKKALQLKFIWRAFDKFQKAVKNFCYNSK